MAKERLPEIKCLQCFAKLNQASDTTDDVTRPKPGDFTICLYCEHLMVFTKGLGLREPTKMETREAEENSDLQEAIELARAYRAFRNKH